MNKSIEIAVWYEVGKKLIRQVMSINSFFTFLRVCKLLNSSQRVESVSIRLLNRSNHSIKKANGLGNVLSMLIPDVYHGVIQ